MSEALEIDSLTHRQKSHFSGYADGRKDAHAAQPDSSLLLETTTNILNIISTSYFEKE